MAAVINIVDVGNGVITVNGNPYAKTWVIVLFDNFSGVSANSIDMILPNRQNGDKIISNSPYTNINLDGVSAASYQDVKDWVAAHFIQSSGGGGGGGDASAANQATEIGKLEDIRQRLISLTLSKTCRVLARAWNAGAIIAVEAGKIVIGACGRADGVAFEPPDMGILTGGVNSGVLIPNAELLPILRKNLDGVTSATLGDTVGSRNWKNDTVVDAWLFLAGAT